MSAITRVKRLVETGDKPQQVVTDYPNTVYSDESDF